MKDIFSSLVFEVKFDRSKKLSVEIGKEEKNGWEGSVVGVGRLLACRVMSDRSRPAYVLNGKREYADRNTYLEAQNPVHPLP